MTTLNILTALLGAAIVFGMRNDKRLSIFGAEITRSTYVGLALVYAFVLISYPLAAVMPMWKVGLFATFGTAIAGFVLTMPHGQTLQGPHQYLPVNEEDPLLEVAMFLTDHDGLGEKMGWPTWLLYNGMRYVAPCGLLAALLHSWAFVAAGILIVLCYWPVAYLPWLRSKMLITQFGAGMCGFFFFGSFPLA